MKKILIMVMSCNQDIFNKECELIRETWAKDIIDGKYENIGFVIYSTLNNINKIQYKQDKQTLYFPNNEKIHHIYKINENENFKPYDEHTYRKTYDAFKLSKKMFEYDYIFRTNTSTYVNVSLLNEFVQSLDNDDIVWTSELYSLDYALTPYPYFLYGRGNGLLLSKKNIDIILDRGLPLYNLDGADDWFIGNILNSYHISNDENYLDYIKSFTHGWYKSTNEPLGNNGTILSRHQLCDFCNNNNSFEFLSKFITIQLKTYIDRNEEINKFKEIDDIIKSEKQNYKKEIEFIKQYSKNPSVFVGQERDFYENYNDIL